MAKPLKNQTALITGASGGIGFEFTRLFAADGYNLVLVARTEAKLRMMAADLSKQYGITVTVVGADLALSDAPDDVFSELQDQHIKVDILVNNAGFGEYGPFKETPLRKELDMVQVNITALMHLTKLFLNQLPARKPGKILNIASLAAFQPGPLMAVYYASKAIVLSFSEALANELQSENITVTVLCPGATETDFEKNASLTDSKLFSRGVADARSVAEAGYQGLMAGETVVIPGIKNKLMALASGLAPRKVRTHIVRKIQEKK